MNKLQPQRFAASLEIKDNNGMIPLHRAALFDFSNVADYLIKCVSVKTAEYHLSAASISRIRNRPVSICDHKISNAHDADPKSCSAFIRFFGLSTMFKDIYQR